MLWLVSGSRSLYKGGSIRRGSVSWGQCSGRHLLQANTMCSPHTVGSHTLPMHCQLNLLSRCYWLLPPAWSHQAGQPGSWEAMLGPRCRARWPGTRGRSSTPSPSTAGAMGSTGNMGTRGSCTQTWSPGMRGRGTETRTGLDSSYSHIEAAPKAFFW